MLNFGKISIIVPMYNSDKTIRRCIESILRQTYSNFELIIVNDGSTDTGISICNELAVADKRIILLNKQNAGAAAARNDGLRLSSGSWVTFVDADDWLEPNTFEILQEHLEVNPDVILFNAYIDNGNESNINYYFDNRTILFQKEKKSQVQLQCISRLPKRENNPQYMHCGASWGKLFKKCLIDNTGLFFDEELIIGEDAIFYLNLYQIANRICYAPQPLYHYSIISTSVTHRFNGDILEYYKKLSEALNVFVVQYHKNDKHFFKKMGWYLVETVNIILTNYYFSGGKMNKFDLGKFRAFINSNNVQVYRKYIMPSELTGYPKQFTVIANNLVYDNLGKIVLFYTYKGMVDKLKSFLKRY